MNLQELLRLPKQVYELPEVTVRLSGDAGCKRMYEFFTRLHPRYKLIQHKRWGVALLLLPDTFEQYLKGTEKQALRTNRRRALDVGLSFKSFNAAEHLEEILAINLSLESRQGARMLSEYVSLDAVRKYFASRPSIYGVFDANGVLKAYAETPICGEAFVLNRLLGHGEELEKGIMYLLVSEVIREMIERKAKQTAPLWGMYDTFFGASPGLRYFKERLGFKPCKVRWVWAQ